MWPLMGYTIACLLEVAAGGVSGGAVPNDLPTPRLPQFCSTGMNRRFLYGVEIANIRGINHQAQSWSQIQLHKIRYMLHYPAVDEYVRAGTER